MDYEAMPKIRLEVEHMKHSIISHIGATGSELGEMMGAEITAAVDSYPWKEQVSKIVHDALEQHISDYFKYGTGREAIKVSVDAAFKEVMSPNALHKES